MSELQSVATSSGTTSEKGSDRRWAHRKSCGYRASICRPGSGTSISCSIVNMSTTGACLEIKDLPADPEQNLHLPAYFTLAIRVDRMEIDCAIVWRKGAQIGVRFLAAPRPLDCSKAHAD
ncbi:MAG: PilZ domain-containing protein [Alphaproteobacteria bacterium]|nr:PilZ domain-containing protein [Alphaproteobacteria bacterium]